MNYFSALKLKAKMPYKDIYFDVKYLCFRLIDSFHFIQYCDEEGKWHKRKNEILVKIS